MSDKARIQNVIDVFIKAKKEIGSILTNKEDADLLLRSETVLNKLINSLQHSIGNNIINEPSTLIAEKKPLKYILGRKIDTVVSPIKNNVLTPNNQEMEKLGKEVEALYNTIQNRDNKEILESCDDLCIRALAKRMGLSYSIEQTPNLTSGFIDDLRKSVINHKAQEESKLDNIHNQKIEHIIKQLTDLGYIVNEEKSGDECLYTIFKGDKKVDSITRDEIINMSNEEYNKILEKYKDIKTSFNFTQLNEVIERAKGIDEKKYTPESFQTFIKKFEGPVPEFITQEEVDSLTLELNKSFEMLVEKTKVRSRKINSEN
ncbi:hypothetical protein ETU09_05830 [Apibacter muscae]|uniref:Uncharacterized protein n=1 Tax=Apibacter muscae TaxID=2509004 RepID=A0A563DET5_9FLAO|nr:hypothetical protein [Apibacter muscae]TWP28443.1 hypothetical protein ETU09_05830 [Apibacter muscae]